ncbi:MAG: phytanoyl-CoA dioxygenase family protein [Candidatus Competibacter sp.]|nr:phytanoyl-CoA dioxygenase family protein [Candidatus Competibacteraceae bacterium]MBL8254867.1 phytanoyl-CoA dioxygenase family protein [Candidatus Competibacter sp.]
MNTILNGILRDATYYILAGFGNQARIASLVCNLILDAVGAIAGANARQALADQGLERLHEHLPSEQIGTLRDQVMTVLRPELFNFAFELGRDFLGLTDEFFIDDYTILRVNYPYAIALKSGETAENPGIGRTDPKVRALRNSTQKRDLVYDPRSYHKQTPPASWAHGPHKDTWTGHSRNGVNLWLAVSRVNEENGMVFYPDTFGKAYQPDPRSLYLVQGYPMPPPNKMALRQGEMLVFNPELLHATHLNTSDQTRIAVSARINPERPRFDPNCFYAREFWHSSRDIESGRPDVIRQFNREENFEDVSSRFPETPVEHLIYTPVRCLLGNDGRERVETAALTVRNGKALVELSDGQRVILLSEVGGWRGVQEMCAHLDVSLMDGHHGDGRIHCPAHGVTFYTASGCSSSELLNLRTFRVTVDGVWLVIDEVSA